MGDIAIVDFSGKITLGEGSATLRTMVRELIGQGHRKILLNLGDASCSTLNSDVLRAIPSRENHLRHRS